MEPNDTSSIEDSLQRKLAASSTSKMHRVLKRLIMAALGSIPWIGGFISASHAIKEEADQLEKDNLQNQWLAEHKEKLLLLGQDIAMVVDRLNNCGEEIADRIESESYLTLVRKSFRSWDQAETRQKREYIVKLISNAGASTLCPDDLIRLFLNWLDSYHEAHFIVIREIYKNPGTTRYDIWANIHGEFPREDSSEADLFRLLIGDLSIGRIIRQHRDVNYQGQFVKKLRPKKIVSTGTMKSAFDDEEPYELTELGKQFVHYVFSDIVTKIE